MGKEYWSERVKSKNENPELLQTIESMRNKLDCLVKTEGMESEQVLALSRDLDKVLLEYYDERLLGRSI